MDVMNLLKGNFTLIRDISPSYINKSRAKIILLCAKKREDLRFVVKIMPKRASTSKQKLQKREFKSLLSLCRGQYAEQNFMNTFYAAGQTRVGQYAFKSIVHLCSYNNLSQEASGL